MFPSYNNDKMIESDVEDNNEVKNIAQKILKTHWPTSIQ